MVERRFHMLHETLVKLLLEKGSNADAEDNYGWHKKAEQLTVVRELFGCLNVAFSLIFSKTFQHTFV
jgi:hypothetical protein